MRRICTVLLPLLAVAGVAVSPAAGGAGGITKSCGQSEGGDVATGIRAKGVGCGEARDIASIYTGSRASICASDGTCRIRGFRCSAGEGNKPDNRTTVLCTKDDGRQSIRFRVVLA